MSISTDGFSVVDKSSPKLFTIGSNGSSFNRVSRKALVTFPMTNPLMSCSLKRSGGYQTSYSNGTNVVRILITPSVGPSLGASEPIGAPDGVDEG